MMLRRASTTAVESVPSFFRLRLRTQPFLLSSPSPLPVLDVSLARVNGSASIGSLSTATERSSSADLNSEEKVPLGGTQPNHVGPGGQYASYGSFREGTAAEEFNQNSQRATRVQEEKGPVDGRHGLSTTFLRAPGNSLDGGSSLTSQHATNGGLHRIPAKGDGWLAATSQQSRNGFSGDCQNVFRQSPMQYPGGANTHRDGDQGASGIAGYSGYLQRPHQQGSDAYHSEMQTGYQWSSADFSKMYGQDSDWNFRGSSKGVKHTDSANPTEHHYRQRQFKAGTPGWFSGSGITGGDNHKGNSQQFLQASDGSLENQGKTSGPYVGNGLSQFLLNGGRIDGETVNTYNGTIDELDCLCKEGKVRDAVKVLGILQQQGVVVDLARYLLLFQLCGEEKCLEEARIVHDHVLRSFVNVEVKVYNKMLDTYCKCGSVEDAQHLFKTMPERNLASWDIMIMGLATNDLGEDAIDLFTEFKQKGLRPDGGLFLTVFHVCGNLGAVDEGFLHFESMSKEFGILPTMEHYCGIVAMLGAAGHLNEAMEFIDTIPSEPTIDLWETLMNLCRVHGNAELGDRCALIIENLDSSKLTEDLRRGLLPVKASDQVKKGQKKADLVSRGRVHEYRAGDRSHPESDKIYALLKSLAFHMRDTGYMPETRFVLHDVDQESKEEALLHHSEKLALSYGLMTSPARSPMRIIKNLRSCGDCHNFMKIVSKLVGRQLIIRDAKRFHHFENGVCSCNDYW